MKKSKKIKEESERGSFTSGVMVLSLSTLLVKVIGLAFKIPMLSFLGTEGMGYFNSAYEIYALLCAVATAGLPVALSMLVSSAEARGDGFAVKRVFKSARRLFFFVGAAGTAFMIFGASRLSAFIGNPESHLSILSIAPALLFICLASAVRGYCQGFGDMRPTAYSQLIEAISKLVLGVLFSVFAIKMGYGVSTVAAFAVLGITVGTFLSLLYLCFASRRHGRITPIGTENCERGTLRILLRIAFPITLGALVMGLTRIIDMSLIMRRLQDIGTSVVESNRIYGAYTTLAVPIFSLIPALIAPISMALVPELSSAIERDDVDSRRDTVKTAMRLTAVLSIPASLGISAFSRPALELLFYGQSEAIEISAPLLSVLGISIVFSCMITTTNAILQSYRRVFVPIVSMSVGVLVKLAVSYILIGHPEVGAMGAPIGSLACSAVAVAINLGAMMRENGFALSLSDVFFKPLAAASVSVGAAFALYLFTAGAMNGTLRFLLSVMVAPVVYVAISLIAGSISAEDIALLPYGDRILKRIKLGNKTNKGERKNDCFGKKEDAS